MQESDPNWHHFTDRCVPCKHVGLWYWYRRQGKDKNIFYFHYTVLQMKRWESNHPCPPLFQGSQILMRFPFPTQCLAKTRHIRNVALKASCRDISMCTLGGRILSPRYQTRINGNVDHCQWSRSALCNKTVGLTRASWKGFGGRDVSVSLQWEAIRAVTWHQPSTAGQLCPRP